MTILIWILGFAAVLFALFHVIRYANRSNLLLYTSAVRKCSSADNKLFHDLVYRVGGVKFADQLSFPDAKTRRLTQIEALQRYDGTNEGLERWTVTRETGSSAYLVRLQPDGAGGTVFSVELAG